MLPAHFTAQSLGSTIRCKQFQHLPPLLQVNAGGRHTLALGADNRLWAFGDNSEGQLGRDSQQDCSPTPVLVQGLPDSAVVQFVVAGGQLAESHVPLPNHSSSLQVLRSFMCSGGPGQVWSTCFCCIANCLLARRK